MTSSPSEDSRSKAVLAIDNGLQRIGDLSDERSRLLIGDTLAWAKNNIERFSIWMPRKQDRYGHLPNLFTLPALFTSISDTAKLWGCNIDKIVHDQQSQFGQTMQSWHSLFEGRLEPERIFHFGDTPIRFGDIANSRFEMRASSDSPGLQAVDVVLWTFARSLLEKPLGRKSRELFELCFSPDDMYFMSLGSILAELEYTVGPLMMRPFGEDQLLDGMNFLDSVERLRQQSIREDLERQRAAE